MTGCVDYYRKLKRVKSQEEEYRQSLAEDEQYLEEEDLKGELLSALEGHIKSLPQRYQDVLRLIYKEGMKPAEVATLLRLPADRVHMIHFRAVGKLRILLRKLLPPDALGMLLLVYFLLHTDNQATGRPTGKEEIFFQNSERK
jgi:DNA-directed RNA polymerase specialized sigma24 family protein